MPVIRIVYFLILVLFLSSKVGSALEKPADEPVLKQAQQLIKDGDYNTARDICEELLKRTPKSIEARELLLTTRVHLKRLADESYFRGIELEHMNNFAEAMIHWKKAILYLRPGDENYQVVKAKLERY